MRRLALIGMALIGVALSASCARASDPLAVSAPGRMQHALTVQQAVSDLGARAQLVPRDGTALDPVALARGADGVSFSGFIASEPGDYTLEIVFDGVRSGASGGERVFLGRYTSDAFTVSRGSSATPRFTRPLDTIGRPEDHGDTDGDGLGLLDELLFGSDPGKSDSDGDGLADGKDCDPTDSARAFMIAAAGSIEDCDGDGSIRPDLPYSQSGTDCDDRDPSIHPGVTDDCSDAIDQDCNAATCPTDDRDRPSISNMLPEAGAAVGCHTRIRAVIRDNAAVASAMLYFTDVPTGGRDSLLMTKVPGEDQLYESEPFDNAATTDGIPAGRHTIEIRARDLSANESVLSREYDFQLDVPRVTRVLPVDVGAVSAGFTITVEATAALGLASITLYAVARSGSGLYMLANAIELGRSTTSPAHFDVDPTARADGEYLLFAVVEDLAGNKATPAAYLTPIGGSPDGIVIDLDYRCIATTERLQMPARVMIIGGSNSPYARTTMRENLDRAIALAGMTDPAAQLVSVIGFGLLPDGKVKLDDASSYIKRWQYAFYNASTQNAVTISWFTPAFAMMNPVVDPHAGNVTAQDAFADPHALLDSDAAVNAFDASGGCPALAGGDNDYILYNVVDGQAVVTVNTTSGKYWRGTATAPVSTIFRCQ